MSATDSGKLRVKKRNSLSIPLQNKNERKWMNIIRTNHLNIWYHKLSIYPGSLHCLVVRCLPLVGITLLLSQTSYLKTGTSLAILPIHGQSPAGVMGITLLLSQTSYSKTDTLLAILPTDGQSPAGDMGITLLLSQTSYLKTDTLLASLPIDSQISCRRYGDHSAVESNQLSKNGYFTGYPARHLA